MERTHRLSQPLSLRAGPWRFNPCCDGTDSSTADRQGTLLDGFRVSILVVMERTHRRGSDRAVERLHPVVSILVVMERTHRLEPDAREYPCKSWFQSLL